MRKLARDRRGVAAIEFALVAPVLLLMLAGLLDIVYLGRGHLRVEAVATQIGQIISQCRSFGGADQTQVINLADEALGPFSKAGRPWGVQVTAIQLQNNRPTVLWVSGNAAQVAGFRTDGATMPNGFTLASNRVHFRTEVVAQVDATFISRIQTGIGTLFNMATRVDNARASILHVSRSPDAGRLGTNASSEACL